ncbi:MAG: 50S ribosomal protein L15 [Acholeplasmatales bacterium]|jgi:large subunit ribosomal protein L15|nr:50S ribosomal protein L15 [Acholeplasmatales bacterium]
MLNELKPVKGARKARKRVGRGVGSGHGETSGKGFNGQLARSGGGPRPGFEGGQIPFFQRLPKRGFNNINRKEYAVVNLGDLNIFADGEVVTPQALLDRRVISRVLSGVKILSNGNLEKVLTIKAHKFSKAAIAKIESNKSTYEVL